jgi:RNA polymerase sigma factor (sigma-70 family)
MNALSDMDTSNLVARVQAGDVPAWTILTDRYTGRLWAIARAMRLTEVDAADAVQTTWLRLVENLDRVHDGAGIGSWLATTMRRECLGVLRRSARTRPTGYGWDELADDGADPPDEALLRTERDTALWRCFCRLSPGCQRLLRVLIADPPPSYAEVSAALEIPMGSIGPSRRRCLNQLRGIMLSGSGTASGSGTTAGRTAGKEGRHE